MGKGCSICGDTQCLNLVEDSVNIKDNICDICKGLSYDKSCDMCQLRFPEKNKFTIGIYLLILIILILSIVILFPSFGFHCKSPICGKS